MKTACMLLAEGFEEIEAVTPIDYLRRAGIYVNVVGIVGKRVRGSHGIIIETDSGPEALEKDNDAIVIPGGMPGASNLANSALVRSLIIRHYEKGKLIAAICASPAIVLHGACNLLQGREFTCYPGTEDQIRGGHFRAERVVKDGNIITSQGPGTAGEFAISIISVLEGPQKANEVAQHALLR